MDLDLSSQDLQVLLRQFEKGKVVLFAGAGFSLGATSTRGGDPPLAAALSKILASECGWDYEGEELSVVYDQARKHLGTTGLNGILSSLYLNCKPADWHNFVSKLFWYRIYSTNIDDVIQNAYQRGAVQRLQTVVCPSSYQDQDMWFESVQCVHLHGSVLDFPKGFTFTFEEFAMQTASPNPWYQAMVEDMQSNSFVFVGTRISEPPLYHYLNMRSQRAKGLPEVRAKAFLVTPEVTHIRRRQLEDQGIVVIETSAEAFFTAIHGEVHGRLATREELLKNRYPHQITAIETGVLSTQAELLKQFELVSHLPVPAAKALPRTFFFEGGEPTWDDIRGGLDAQRGKTHEWLQKVGACTTGRNSFIVVAHAGAGKSTVLRRMALELAREGHTVYFSKTPYRIEKRPLVSLMRSLDGRNVFLIIDDAAVHMHTIDEIFGELPEGSNVTVILADRPHVIYPRLAALKNLRPIMLEIPYLDAPECERMIDKLKEFGFLGALQGKPRAQQVSEFLWRSKKQLLVAMKEATSGIGFNAILLNEFGSLSGDNARLAYTMACIAYVHGAPVRKRHLLACIEGTDFQKANTLVNDLREVVIPWRESDEFVCPRHRVIAHVVAKESAPFELKKAALLSYLTQISGDMTPQNISRRTPEYVGYRGAINFDNMLDLFGEDYETIATVYGELRDFYSEDFLFWLQFGRAEVYFDHFAVAENYLNQSLGIRDAGNFQARHHMGVLFLKRALYRDTAASAAEDAERGEEILRKQIAERGKLDAYPCAALVKHKLRYLKKWGSAKLTELLGDLHDIAEKGMRLHPFDEAMREARDEVYRVYLMQAVTEKATEAATEPVARTHE